MTIQRMEHVGIVVDDLSAAPSFFVELGLKLLGEGRGEGGAVDRVVGLEGVRTEVAMVETPDGHGRLELVKCRLQDGGRARAVPLDLRQRCHSTCARQWDPPTERSASRSAAWTPV